MFADRAEAGRLLAARLDHLREEDPIVLALPRGGVPVAFEVAQTLAAPLDVILVRKIGAPGQPELALGAVVDGGAPQLVLNRDVLAHVLLPEGYLEQQEREQLAEIERRRQLYCEGRPPADVTGRTVVIVDDGIATGATAKAAVKAMRAANAGRVVLAVPVLPAGSVEEWRVLVDELVFVDAPRSFGAVGLFYGDFSQTSDAEVTRLLRLAQHRPAASADSDDDASPGAHIQARRVG